MSDNTYLERRRTVEATPEVDNAGEPTGNVIVEGDHGREILTADVFHARYEKPRQRAPQLAQPGSEGGPENA